MRPGDGPVSAAAVVAGWDSDVAVSSVRDALDGNDSATGTD